MPTIKIIDTSSEQVLFECPITEMEVAFREAAQYEQYGVDVKIVAPTVTETLGEALGLSEEDRVRLADSSHDEIADHEGSCCATPNGKVNIH